MRATYELRLEGAVFHLRVDRGKLEHGRGRVKQADLVVETDGDSLIALLRGRLSAADAVEAGVVKINGGLDRLHTMLELFVFQQPESAAVDL